ncbi:MAG: outer membrane protein assembly factor BamA [Candidatus Omnitrophota bacterium]
MIKGKKLSLIALCLFVFLCASMVFAAGAAGEKHISSIKVKGNQAISTATVLNRLKMKPGDVFEESALNKELKRLYGLGYFSDVFVETKDLTEGVAVTFTVVEKPIIYKIEFRGNTKIKTGKLAKKITVKEGSLVDFSLISHDVGAIRNFYVEQGYNNVEVDYKIEPEADTGRANLVFLVNEGIARKVASIDIEGNKSVPDDEIKKYMSTKTAWWFIRKGAFDEEKFQGDLERIKSFYRSKGFLDARVSGKQEFSADGTKIYVKVQVDEGKKYLVGDVYITGSLAFPETEIRKAMKIRSGDPFDYMIIKEDIDNVRALYYDRGYMNAEVNMQHKYNPKTDRMDLNFDIIAHDEVYVGKINIIGNTKTRDKVIRRELRIYPGEKYNGKNMKYSKERIYNLGFFEDVYFDTVQNAENDVKDLNVTVKETKTGELSFGGGYSSIDAFIGFAQIRQRNFDLLNFPGFTGGGQDLTIRAELGSARQNYFLNWTDPWIFDLPLLFGFDIYRQEQDRFDDSGYGYDERRTGGSLRLGKDITDQVGTGLVYNLEEVAISNIPDNATQDLKKEQGSNWISRLTWNLAWDTRDNKYSPTKGWITGVSLEDAGGFLGGDKSFVKGYGYASYYMSFIETFVLELQMRGGSIESYGDTDEVPIYERFFAGGASTIRGYKQRGVGPRDRGTNAALGGGSMLIGNAEVTFPIFKKLIKGAVFYDVGNVWEKSSFSTGGTKDDTGFKSGTGVGVRVKTPIGPVKLDYGFPLNNNYDDKREGQFYFSVSHGF